MRRTLGPSCSHGISDSVTLTFRHVLEDFIGGTKVTVFGYECAEHGRPGIYRVDEQVRKIEVPERTQP